MVHSMARSLVRDGNGLPLRLPCTHPLRSLWSPGGRAPTDLSVYTRLNRRSLLASLIRHKSHIHRVLILRFVNPTAPACAAQVCLRSVPSLSAPITLRLLRVSAVPCRRLVDGVTRCRDTLLCLVVMPRVHLQARLVRSLPFAAAFPFPLRWKPSSQGLVDALMIRLNCSRLRMPRYRRACRRGRMCSGWWPRPLHSLFRSVSRSVAADGQLVCTGMRVPIVSVEGLGLVVLCLNLLCLVSRMSRFNECLCIELC